MTYNFHTHTYLCHHASGTPEEYVLRAIEGGITEMGFSDHFPFAFADGTEDRARISVKEASIYLDEIARLKKKYREKITIYLGFEMEYYTEHFDIMKAKAQEYGADYLLLGEHYVQHYPSAKHTCVATESEELLALYADRVIAGMKTGAFTYLAHPDVLNFKGSAQAYEKQMRRIAQASLDLFIPLEINFLGIRDGRHYPNMDFWKIAGEVGAPVTFGFDAHTTDAAYDGASLAIAKKMVSDLHLNYIGKPILRPIV